MRANFVAVACLLNILPALASGPADGAFDHLKSLEGTWAGLVTHGGSPRDGMVIYRVTEGGKALVETQFVGSKAEVTTTYRLVGKQLMVITGPASKLPAKLTWLPAQETDQMRFDSPLFKNRATGKYSRQSLRLALIGSRHLVIDWQLLASSQTVIIAKCDLHRRLKP